MPSTAPQHSWFRPRDVEKSPQEPHEYERLWQAFMTARVTLGLVLLVLQVALTITGTAPSFLLIAICAAYCGGTLATRLMVKPRPLGGAFNSAWGVVVGVDVVAFSLLQLLQNNSVNYTPLFALPILLASVLGSLRLAMGTAAGVTVWLLADSVWTYVQNPHTVTPYFVQAALSGVGYFVIAFLANQLASRLATEGKKARVSQQAATVQRQVNELVIESLSDGVLVADATGSVRAANPAARQLLGGQPVGHSTGFSLTDQAGWRPLLSLMQLSFGTGHNQEESVTLRHIGHGPRHVMARTRLTQPLGDEGESLCVLFLQDQRELEARIRTDKLASMGRMSTAVAHEIRNPLAAIAQANALLEEDVVEPRLKKLTAMVGQNAKRLEKIVEDILDVARVPGQGSPRSASDVDLNHAIQRICTDWAPHAGSPRTVRTHLSSARLLVKFDPEHLRRVLVNLLDNAHRYANKEVDSVQVSSILLDGKTPAISVWSDGLPMEQSLERHLFEPFFSSESRSSGLGLYICRELCAGHGASIVYQRSSRLVGGARTEGNEFMISFATSDATPSA